MTDIVERPKERALIAAQAARISVMEGIDAAKDAEIARLRALVEEMGKGLVRIERMANTIQFNGNQQPIPHENHMRAWRDVETAALATIAAAKGEEQS